MVWIPNVTSGSARAGQPIGLIAGKPTLKVRCSEAAARGRVLSTHQRHLSGFSHGHEAVIRNACRRFTVLCRELKRFSQAVVATDGSKFKAVNG